MYLRCILNDYKKYCLILIGCLFIFVSDSSIKVLPS